MQIKMERASLIRKIKARIWLICLLFSLLSSQGLAQPAQYTSVKSIEKDFRALLKRPKVDLRPSFQIIRTDSVIIERGYIYSQEDEKVPVLIYKPLTVSLSSFPVMICLHGTGGSKEEETIKGILYRLSKEGIMGIAIDARYHGERVQGGAMNKEQYVEAISRAWSSSDNTQGPYPFLVGTPDSGQK